MTRPGRLCFSITPHESPPAARRLSAHLGDMLKHNLLAWLKDHLAIIQNDLAVPGKTAGVGHPSAVEGLAGEEVFPGTPAGVVVR